MVLLIQGRFIFLGINGLIGYCLFHVLEWWQHEFRVKAMTVSHDVNTGTGKSNCEATFFFSWFDLMFSYKWVTIPNGSISIKIHAGGYSLSYFSLKCRMNSSFELFSSLSTNAIVRLNLSVLANNLASVIQKILSVSSATMFASALRKAISTFSISLKRNSRSFLSKRYRLSASWNVLPAL